MKNSKVLLIFGALLIFLIVGGFFSIKYLKIKKGKENLEYIPQEEITQEQSRQTIISLYFENIETGEINSESRLIDIKELMELPYEKLVNLLIQGPKNDKLKKVIPDGTKILKTFMENDCLYLDFTSDILNFNKEDLKIKNNIIQSISKTMTQLTEVNHVKILVDGKEDKELF